MNKIISTEKAVQIAQALHIKKLRIVLVGGCFDILHLGHIQFLTKAKAKGDILLVFIESDENIKRLKGPNRPINTQRDRAKLLASLEIVNYVILLKSMMPNSEYDRLVIEIKPNIIATTKGDPNRLHKERQADLIGGKVIDVTLHVQDQSTTNLLKIL